MSKVYVERAGINMANFAEIQRLVRQAKKSIDFVQYVFEGVGDQTLAFAYELNRAVQRGVQVRLVGNRSMLFQRSRFYGMYVTFCAMLRSDTNLQIREWRHHIFNNIHSKLFICDGVRVMSTGVNMQSFVPYCEWTDMYVTVKSKPCAIAAKTHFDMIWRQSRVTTFPVGTKLPKWIPKLNYGSSADVVIINRYAKTGQVLVHMPCATCARTRFTELTSAHYQAIANARHRIDLLAANIDEPHGETLLRQAYARGVHIRILTSLEMNKSTQKLRLRPTNLQAYKKLKDISEWRFTNRKYCDKTGQKCTWCSPFPTTFGVRGGQHGKALFVDDESALIGSANFEILAFRNSSESIIALTGAQVVKPIRQKLFERLWKSAESL